MNVQEFICWLSFLIIVLFLFILLLAVLNTSLCDDKPNDCEYIDISSLRTGDIVGTSYNRINGYFISAWSKSSWSHTGIVWRDPLTNIPYVIEVCRYRDDKYKGFIKIPFITWMKYNKKACKGLLRYKGEDLDPVKLKAKFDSFKGSRLEGFNVGWKRFLTKKDYDYDLGRSEGDSERYTCFEVTIILLQDAGVYSKEYSPCSYFPGSIMNRHVKTINGNYYEKVKEIKLIKEGNWF